MTLLALFGSDLAIAAPHFDPQASYGAAWSPALGAWLPHDGAMSEPSHVRTVRREDAFECGHGAADAIPGEIWDHERHCAVLQRGTVFVYGGGSPKGQVLYDRRHGIVFFDEGCCTYRTYVLARRYGPPPKALHAANLDYVRTKRGIALGMTPDDVKRRYGVGTLESLRPTYTRLAYAMSLTIPGIRSSDGTSPCEQRQRFIFRAGRLVSIELYNGC